MAYQRDSFRAAYIDFHEQGLGRHVWIAATNGEDPIPILKEYVEIIKGEPWDSLIEYSGIYLTDNRNDLPVNIPTFIHPVKVHIEWSPA